MIRSRRDWQELGVRVEPPHIRLARKLPGEDHLERDGTFPDLKYDLEAETIPDRVFHLIHGSSPELSDGFRRKTARIERSNLETQEDRFHRQPTLLGCHAYVRRKISRHSLAARPHDHSHDEWCIINGIN